MTKIQQEIIETLKENHCNISDAILGQCRYDDYLLYLREPDFNAGVEEAKQIRNDFVGAQNMKLIGQGDRVAIAEYNKMVRQSSDANDAKQIRKEFMRVCIELAETKGKCLKEYCQVFNSSSKQSEKQYDAVVNEYNLITPYERSKLKQKIHDESMSALFDKGELSEVDMYSRMLSKALYDSESSEYPGERSKARADVISINQRLDEIHERQRRESESDDSELTDKVDAVLFGSSVAHVKRVRESLEVKEIQEIENGTS